MPHRAPETHMKCYRIPWWKTPPLFYIDLKSQFKSACIGWLVIVWTWDDFSKSLEAIMWDPD